MEIRRVPVGRLNPAAYNPRKDLSPNDPAYKKLARSMGQFGYVEPIVWNERTGNVIGGHQRLKVLMNEGHREIDVSVVNLSETDEKALNVALNKISGEWDMEKLHEIMLEFSGEIDVTVTGFDLTEIDEIFTAAAVDGIHFEVPGMEERVNSFFEEGDRSKLPANDRQVETILPAPRKWSEEEKSDPAPECIIVVLHVPAAETDVLIKFLEDRGIEYRVEGAKSV